MLFSYSIFATNDVIVVKRSLSSRIIWLTKNAAVILYGVVNFKCKGNSHIDGSDGTE